MIKSGAIGILLIAGLLGGCSKRDTPAPEAAAERSDAIAAAEDLNGTGTAAFDACKLLTPEEIASVQGEAPARSQLVGESGGPLSVSQCNFLLPAGSNSMAVRVVERGTGPQARDPKEVWQETFYGPEAKAVSAERKARKFQKVDGLGEGAFWLGDAKSGGLHVLKGNRFIRVSVGGVDDLQTKIEKSSKLVEFVLPRLSAEN